MKVKVNKDICLACGACTAIAQDFFEISDEDGVAVPSNNGSETFNKEENSNIVTDEFKDSVLEAADSCPVGAIEIIEE